MLKRRVISVFFTLYLTMLRRVISIVTLHLANQLICGIYMSLAPGGSETGHLLEFAFFLQAQKLLATSVIKSKGKEISQRRRLLNKEYV